MLSAKDHLDTSGRTGAIRSIGVSDAPLGGCVTEDRRAGAERIAARTGRVVDQILDSPYFLVGTVEAIVDQLVGLRERLGISYISVFPSDTEAFAPVVERLAAK